MKEKVQKFIRQSRQSYKTLPDKKQYIEFFTALLSVPVLLTVILLNVNNLRATTKPATTTVVPTPVKEIIYVSPQGQNVNTGNNTSTQLPVDFVPTASPACDKSMGPVAIKTPADGDTVNDNPVSVIISYEQGNHCAVVWAYRINNGKWSDYDDKSIALYNLSNGTIVFDLKVKSIVTGEEKVLSRTFSYTGNTNTSNTASASAN
jgi:hypothetical protein